MKAIFPGVQGGPLMHVIAAKAVAFGEALQDDFHTYSARVIDNPQALGRVLRDGGLRLVTDGTDCHLLLVDLTPFGLDGRAAAEALERVSLTVNKNAIPFDQRPPACPSGIRLGTPAGTSRGFGTAEFEEVGELILAVLNGMRTGSIDDGSIRGRILRLVEPHRSAGECMVSAT